MMRDARHAGEILEDHARGLERDLDGLARLRRPRGEAFHVVLGHLVAVAIAQRGLDEDADGIRHALERDAERSGELVEAMNAQAAGRGIQRGERAERIVSAGVHRSILSLRRRTGPSAEEAGTHRVPVELRRLYCLSACGGTRLNVAAGAAQIFTPGAQPK